MPDEITDTPEETAASDKSPSEMLVDGLNQAAASQTTEPVEETVAPDVTADVPTETATEPAEVPWYATLSELGFEGVDTEEAARERAIAALRDYREREQQLASENESLRSFVGYGQQYLQLQSDPEYQRFLSQRQQPQPEEERPRAWWNPPEFNQELAKKHWKPKHDPVTNQTQMDWEPGTPEAIKQSALEYNAYIEEWSSRLQTEPHKALPPVIQQTFVDALEQNDPAVSKALTDFFERRFSQIQQKQQEQSFLDTIRSEKWLYQMDPITNQPKVDSRGSFVLSPEGKRVMDYVQDAADSGITDLQKQWTYATKLARLDALEAAGNSQEASHTAAQVREQKKQEHLKRAATGIPDRSGSVVNSTRTLPQNPHLQTRELFRSRLAEAGIS